MSNQSELNTVMGNRSYSIESLVNGLGSNVSFSKLLKRTLVLPPEIKSATDKANIHYTGVRGLEEFAYAYGMISEAESFVRNWPMFVGRFRNDKQAWSVSGVNVKSMVAATPEWVALTNVIALTKEFEQTLDPEVQAERQAVYQRWWGLVALPNPEMYQAIGVAVTDEIQDEVLDSFSGFGRPQARQYYPSVTQSFLMNDSKLLRVSLLDNNGKRGRIVDVKGVDGSSVIYATQNPYRVEVVWDDGSRENLSYLQVRQLDPVLGEPMFCRAQQILSPYDNFGKIDSEDNFVNKLATVLVLSAFDIGFSHTTYTANQIIRKWTNMASGFLQPAAKSVTYNNMIEAATPTNKIGWASSQGQRIMEQMWGILMDTNSLSDLGSKVKLFLDKIIVLPLGTVTDSGLVLCPHCKKCENISVANFVDFGIQTNDQDGFSSIKWQTRNVKGVEKFNAVGLVKCNNCSSHYYRKFYPSTQPFDNQIPIAEPRDRYGDRIALRLVAPKPNLYLNMSRQGGTAADGEIMGYSFIPRFNFGETSNASGLPVLRLFGELESNGVTQVRAADIPLEVGTQSRNLVKERWCSGQNLINLYSGITSHEWYDANVGDGDGDFLGTNTESDAYSPNNRTGMRRCDWCNEVSSRLNTYIPETWVAGTGSAALYSASSTKEFLPLSSASGNDIFNQKDVDYVSDGGETIELSDTVSIETAEKILFYRIRMLGNDGLVKILEIKPDDLGVEIPALDDSPSLVLLPFDNVCPNEDKVFLTPYRAFYEDYLKKEQQHFKQESRFLVTEQLAYSAYYNKNAKKWEAKKPPSSYLQQQNSRANLFNSLGERKIEWSEGNRDSVTPQGSKPRFPIPKLGKGSAAAIITPYADNRIPIPLRQYHNVIEVGRDVEESVSEDSGQKTVTVTPYYHCPECNDSFHGAPTTEEANIWKFPEPVGQEVLKNGWDIDKKTNSLKFTPSNVETERRNDGGGGYNPKSKWHWTLPLYTEQKPFTTWLESQISNNPKKIKSLNFTPMMVKWLKLGQEFPEEGGEIDE
jgi:hypothetical protein